MSLDSEYFSSTESDPDQDRIDSDQDDFHPHIAFRERYGGDPELSFMKCPERLKLGSDDYYDHLADFVDANNVYREELITCYKIVEDFIRRKGRILVGGMSIDYALKLVGDKLYDKLNIDYDFISPEYFQDAYELGEIIAQKFDDVSVIGAKHVSTMRVRYNFMTLADITYVPPVLYDKIKFIMFNGIKVIHPHVQMIDQMRAISRMAEDPPQETYTSDRVSKDIKRFCMLSKYYEIPESPKKIKPTFKQYKIRTATLANQCITGMPAVAYWLDRMGIKEELSIDITSSNIVVSVPESHYICVLTDDIGSIKFDVVESYRAILDKVPAMSVGKLDGVKVHIYDAYGETYVAEELDHKIWVMGIHGVFIWLLVQWLFFSDEFCGHLCSLFWRKIGLDFNGTVKLMPDPIKFYGKYNLSDSHQLSLLKQRLVAQGKQFVGMIPKNAYPKKGEKINPEYYKFDPDNKLLRNDGSKIL